MPLSFSADSRRRLQTSPLPAGQLVDCALLDCYRSPSVMPHVPNHPSAIKRHRRSLKRRVRNRAVKSHVHSAVKSAQETLSGGNLEQGTKALQEAMKVLGKAATKGVIHRNTASRRLSRLSARIKALPAKA